MDSADLALLATLDALLQAGSVSGAARRMGLSTPAMSHALARIRRRIGDPILVRAGRGMLLTPRAEALKPRVHAVVSEAQQILLPEAPLKPRELSQTFVVHASDYVLCVLGPVVDRLLLHEAPLLNLRFVANVPDDALRLRDGGADLTVGIYGELPPELRSRPLLTDRFVCAVRRGHPEVSGQLSLEQFVRIPHVQVAPRGKPGGYIDDVLSEHGVARRVARAVPYFLSALQLVAQTDYLLTISERIATRLAPTLGLELLEVPLPLRPYALSLLWHPRCDADPGHRFLREVFSRAASEAAAFRHERPRTRLEVPGGSATGRHRKSR